MTRSAYRRAKLALSGTPLRADEKKAREARRAARVAEIREAVVARAGGQCECCGRRGPGAMDHFLGGNGRRRQLEAVATCWWLCLKCNDRRTRNFPDAGLWNELFAHHCRKHGYPVVQHFVKEGP